MIFPIVWTTPTAIQNLPQLLDRYRAHGGSIVQYERVFSFIIYSRRSPAFEWVAPHKSRRMAGLKHALWCLFFGFWSFAGFFWTPGSIINNLMGGIDVTRVLSSPIAPIDGQVDDSAIKEFQAAEKRRQYVFAGLLLLLVLWIIIPRL